MVSRISYVVGSTIFFLFIINVTAMIGTSVITGFDLTPVFQTTGISVLDLLIGVVNNLFIFYALLTTSSELFLFGSVVTVTYVTGMIIVIMEMLRGN